MKSTSVIKSIKGKILGYLTNSKVYDYDSFFKSLMSGEFAIFSESGGSNSIFLNTRYSIICGGLHETDNYFTLQLRASGVTLTIQGLVILRLNDLVIKTMSNGNTFKFSDIEPDFVLGNTKLYLIKEPLVFTN